LKVMRGMTRSVWLNVLRCIRARIHAILGKKLSLRLKMSPLPDA